MKNNASATPFFLTYHMWLLDGLLDRLLDGLLDRLLNWLFHRREFASFILNTMQVKRCKDRKLV
jgi:hypothetical protein